MRGKLTNVKNVAKNYLREDIIKSMWKLVANTPRKLNNCKRLPKKPKSWSAQFVPIIPKYFQIENHLMFTLRICIKRSNVKTALKFLSTLENIGDIVQRFIKAKNTPNVQSVKRKSEKCGYKDIRKNVKVRARIDTLYIRSKPLVLQASLFDVRKVVTFMLQANLFQKH